MKRVKKPWGDFKRFVLNKKCTVKIITVNPKSELSLQKHKHRAEMWYFLTDGYAQKGKKRFKVKKGEIVKIERGVIHRLYAGSKKIEVLEITIGNHDEKDIIRIEDKYGRV